MSEDKSSSSITQNQYIYIYTFSLISFTTTYLLYEDYVSPIKKKKIKRFSRDKMTTSIAVRDFLWQKALDD